MKNEKKYRAYKGEEILDLVGKIIKDDDKHYLITGCHLEYNEVYSSEGEFSTVELLDDCLFKDGSKIGIEIELSADGLTIEEFEKKVIGNFENVESFNRKDEDNDEGWTEYKFLAQGFNYEGNKDFILRQGLGYYRIKECPKQIWIRPKDGFRGSVYGNVKEDKYTKECIAVCKNSPSPYKVIEDTASIAVNYDNFHTKMFSSKNPPSQGTRFKNCNSGICAGKTIRYVKYIKDGLVSDSEGRRYDFKNIDFIDFEICED